MLNGVENRLVHTRPKKIAREILPFPLSRWEFDNCEFTKENNKNNSDLKIFDREHSEQT